MRRLLDLSRPDVVFGICWGGALVLSASIPISISVEPDRRVQWLIVGNILSFFLIYALVDRATRLSPAAPRINFLSRGSWEERTLRRFTKALLVFWAAFWVLTIAASGGLPVFWLLTGSGKTYTDFGVPSLSGFLNLIRAFMFSAGVLLYLQTKRIQYLVMPFGLFVTTVSEVSRGGVLVLLAHGLGVVLLRRQLTAAGLLRLAGGAAAIVVGFGILGEFRGTELNYASLAGEQDWFLTLPVGVLFAFIYLVSPLNNLYYAADSIHPTFTPYFTSQGLFPSFIRAVIFPEDLYPVDLKSEAFNATTFYSPVLADFGWVGAFLVVLLFQWICSYVHVRARRGSYFHTLAYAPLFMSVLLSVFYMYFLSLVTVLYPVLVSVFMRFRRNLRRRRKSQRRIEASAEGVCG